VGDDTTHVTKIDYVAEDHASATARKIAEAYRSPAEAVNKLKDRFREFRGETLLMATGALGVGLGLGALVEKAKDANKEFSGAQRSIAGALTTMLDWPKAVEPVDRYHRSLKLAAGITKELDERSTDMGASLDDTAAAYKTLAVAAAPAHLSQKQLMDLTEKSIGLAKQFGEQGTTAADAIGKALVTKTVRATGDLGFYLREVLGKDLRRLDNPRLLAKMDTAFKGSVDVAREMAGGMGGSFVKIQRTIDELVRGATGPLFKDIAKTVGDVAKRLREAGADGRPLVDVIGTKLVGAFGKLKDMVGFVADHWRLLAAGMVAFKLPAAMEGVAGLLGGLRGVAGGGVFRNLGGAFGSMMGGGGVGGVLGFVGALGPAAGAVGGLAAAATLAGLALKGVYDEWQGRKKQAADLGGFFREIGKVTETQRYMAAHGSKLTPDQMEAGRQFSAEHAALAAEVLKQKGLLENGSISMEKFNGVMDSMSEDVRRSFAATVPGAPEGSSGLLGAYAAEVFRRAYQAPADAIDAGNKDDQRKLAGKNYNFYGDVHFHQNFEDTDADRVMVRSTDDLENYVNRRTQSPLSQQGSL
jgi:hypothetical protein